MKDAPSLSNGYFIIVASLTLITLTSTHPLQTFLKDKNEHREVWWMPLCYGHFVAWWRCPLRQRRVSGVSSDHSCGLKHGVIESNSFPQTEVCFNFALSIFVKPLIRRPFILLCVWGWYCVIIFSQKFSYLQRLTQRAMLPGILWPLIWENVILEDDCGHFVCCIPCSDDFVMMATLENQTTAF